jgi:hypothetical protein
MITSWGDFIQGLIVGVLIGAGVLIGYLLTNGLALGEILPI